MAAACAAFFMPGPAAAQVLCGDRTEVGKKLKESYSETPANIGLAGNGAVVEVFVSPDGSFTIIMTHPGGLSCLMAAGEGWETVQPPPDPET